jgi:NAD(P)-dependent dehydrogenase (short-subunit alcohol dehydrogenase family)
MMPPSDHHAPAISGIEGKAILVTGAASGIGRATCLLFARHGAAIVAADANVKGLAQLLIDIGESGGQVSTFAFDVGDPAQCAALVAEAARRLRRIDVLVHGAGILVAKPLLELSNDEWRQTLRINLDGTFFITRDVGRIMAANNAGTMILLTSDRGLYGSVDFAHYAASKGGMIALMRSLALALGKYGVTVNGVNPGMTDTPMARGGNRLTWDAKLAADVLGKASLPEEIAQTLLFLADIGGRYTTGQVLGTRLRHGQ